MIISTGLSRRKFIEKGALGISALTSAQFLSQMKGEKSGDLKDKKGRLALQLWTLRNEIESKPEETLRRIKGLGYNWVETAFFPDDWTLKRSADLLKSFELKVCSIHTELPQGPHRDKMLQMSEAYECSRLVWHGWPEDLRYKSKDGIKELADIFNESNQFASSNGLQFGLHNHWWECERHASGELPLDILCKYLDPSIFLEIDTYWVKVGGEDPAEVVSHYGERVPFLHIKDGPARWIKQMDEDQPEPMVAVGQGSLDFPDIVKAAAGNTEFMIVELDNCATDIFEAIEASANYLVQNELALS